MSKYLENMNPEQTEVILHEHGPLGVFATAGAGKTRAVVNRIARLVGECNVPADRILAVTFSAKGAEEMNTRLKALGIEDARVGTWHALSLHILRADYHDRSRWDIDSANKHKTLVKDAIGYKHLDWKGCDVNKLCGFIGFCKANLWDVDASETMAHAAGCFGQSDANRAVNAYRLSELFIEEKALLTFDDMLVNCHDHLAVHVNQSKWSQAWDYIIQDEAQDQNRAQKNIASLLAKDHRNYMIVGDPAQSIYAFRGSSPEYIMDFATEWNAKIVYMGRNYRSGSQIIQAANNAIRPAKTRLPIDMMAERGTVGHVRISHNENLEGEAESLADLVKETVRDGGNYRDVTCLYRTNAQSRALEEALLRNHIPYVVIGSASFYERKEVKGLLAYLRIAITEEPTEDDLKRSINAPFRFLGGKFVERVTQAHTKGEAWTSTVARVAAQDGIQSRQKSSATDWARIIGEISEMSTTVDDETSTIAKPDEVLAHIIRSTKYIEWLNREEGEESIENSHASNVRELIRVASAFPNVHALLKYIEDSMREAAKQRQRKAGDRVLLMSVHRSKGLEWPTVFVAGCNEGILPHAKAEIEEERRLFYVACTRARDTLMLSYVSTMAMASGVRELAASRFLYDAGILSREENEENPVGHEEDRRNLDRGCPMTSVS